jgi:hypothetical protein
VIVKGGVRRLASRLAYADRASGVPAKRQWLKWFEQVTRPRITAARQAEQDLWDGLLGELAWKCEEARRAADLADGRPHHELKQRTHPSRCASEIMFGPDAESTRSVPQADREAGQ